MSQDSAMVGPTASVLTPCVPSAGAPSRAARCASRIRRLCGTLLSLAVLLPSAAAAQGPGGPIQQTGFGGHGGVISRHLHPYPMGPAPAPPCPEVTFEYVPPHDDRLQRHLFTIASTVERRAKMLRNDELRARYGKTRAYRSATGLKAARTRQRNLLDNQPPVEEVPDETQAS